MTEEELKILCKSLEERYGENSTITLKQSDFNNMWASINRYAKENKRLQEQLKESIKTTKDQEFIIKKLKRRRICDNQKTEARKEHINELIAQVARQKEEIAKRGRLINELKSQRKEANEVIKWYDGLENILVGWELYTGQPKGTANKYLEKWGIE